MAAIKAIIGTRAELIKTFPVLKHLSSYSLIASGQHNLDRYADLFGVEVSRYITEPPSASTTKFYGKVNRAVLWSVSLLPKISKEVSRDDVIIYHGDTMTTAVTALATFLKGANGVHLEAGLRSGDIFEPFPEEISRIIADRFSRYRLAVSKTAYMNLIKEHLAKGTFLFGNTIIDSVYEALRIARSLGYRPFPGKYAIVTVHRHENLKSRERMEKIVQIIEEVPYETYFFYHDNTIHYLKKYGLYERVAKKVNFVRLSEYPNFLAKLKRAKMILTDGGSIQEESLVLKIPCIILRKRTERVEGLATGINFLTELNVEKARHFIQLIVEKKYPKRFENPYGYRGISKEIAEFIEVISG